MSNTPRETVQPAGVSQADACRILGISDTTLWRLMKRSQLATYTIGTRRLVLASEIARLTAASAPPLRRRAS